jgi:hypothetical protein
VSTVQQVKYKFLDGPLADQEQTRERGLERIDIGGDGVAAIFTYEWAGNDGATVLMAKRHKNRAIRRLVMQYIGRKAKHPAIMALSWRRFPTTGKTVKTGKGAAARAAKRAAS